MNALQEATLNMQRGVEQHLDANTTIITAVPAFLAAFNKLAGFNAEILADVGGQETARTGVSKDKQTGKIYLTEVALKVANPTRAYATQIKNNTLRDEVDYAFTELSRLRDDQIAPRCQIIHDRAAANLAALAEYGVTAEKLEALQTAIDNFSAEVPKPRAARAARSVKTANLSDLFRQSKEVLTVMDDLTDIFKDDHPDFVAKYNKLREIDKPPSRPRKPKGKKTGNTVNSGDAPT